MLLYRVFPWTRGARRGEMGHPTFAPRTQGQGRIDNPDHYRVLYGSEHPAGAIAERFARVPDWSTLFEHRHSPPTTVVGFATLRLESPAVIDLDDGRALVERNLKPSEVATRDRTQTQLWALGIYQERRWTGIRWWSSIEARWGNVGLWERARVSVSSVEPLTAEHPAFVEAARILLRA